MDIGSAIIHDRIDIVLFRDDLGAENGAGSGIALIDLIIAFLSIASIVFVIETEEMTEFVKSVHLDVRFSYFFRRFVTFDIDAESVEIEVHIETFNRTRAGIDFRINDRSVIADVDGDEIWSFSARFFFHDFDPSTFLPLLNDFADPTTFFRGIDALLDVLIIPTIAEGSDFWSDQIAFVIISEHQYSCQSIPFVRRFDDEVVF